MPIIPVDGCGDIGVMRDGYAHDLPNNAWSRAQNVRFRDGYAERFAGHASIYGTPSVAPVYVQPLSTPTGRFWLYAGTQKLYSVTGSTHTNITRQSAGVDVNYTATAGAWCGGTLGGIAVLTDGTDTPQAWAGTGKAIDMTNWPANTLCKVLRPFKSILMAANVTKSGTNYPHMVKWSHPADPGALPVSWDPADATKDAGEIDLADDQTRIVDAIALGDVFVVYKEGAYYGLQYIGPPYIFRVQKLSNVAGALSLNCAAEFPGGHVVLGQGDVITHAGGAPQSILDRRMRRWLFNSIDSTAYTKSFVATNLGRNESWVCFPQNGATACNMALVWNYKDNTLAVRELPNVDGGSSGVIDYSGSDSWDSDPDAWYQDGQAWNQTDFTQSAQRLVLASSANSKIYLADSSTQFDGTAISAYIEREGLTFGDPASVKLLKSVRPQIDAIPGTVLQISVGGAMDLDAGTTWQAPVNFTVGTDQKIDCFATGRYLALRIASTDYANWRLKRYDMDIETMGLF